MLCGCLSVGFAAVQDPARWENAIREFEAADERNSPGQVEILFLGSSSIRLWDLDHYFPGLRTLNRGFGGSQISDSLHYAERLVLPYSPDVIVFYAGDNDINSGKSPQVVYEDYRAFATKIRRHLSHTRIIFVAIKPSLSRWHLVEEMRKANKMIEEFSRLDPCLEYLDIDNPMIGLDGRPRKELFVEDGLHLSTAGYQLWTEALVPLLDSGKGANCATISRR
jgi:lysophospholipase L1-like esterase